MRLRSLLTPAVLAAALAAHGVSLAQDGGFTISPENGEPAPLPTTRPETDGADAVLPPPPTNRFGRPTPPPFDINGDGRAPVVNFQEEPEVIFRPSTTVSPLSDGRGPLPVLPFDATNRSQLQDLTRLLHESNEDVRELRVLVDGSQQWIDAVIDRPIVPRRTIRLDGEIDYASWTFFLSAAEASRGGTLTVGFTNSVLVLPEASRLRVFLNGRQIAQTAIDSPDRTKVIALPIAAGLLRPGNNAVRIETDMRHRIDCSVDATFELWTRIDTRLTGFSFDGGRATLSGLNDIPGVGVGSNGATLLRILQRNPASGVNKDRALRAAQAAAVRGRFVQPLVEVSDLRDLQAPAPGVLNIIIGTYNQLQSAVPSVPAEGASGPILALVDNADLGPTVFITGPSERAVENALARFNASGAQEAPRLPIAATPPWLVPDSVPIEKDDGVSLDRAGVKTINFSGRRFTTDFRVTLPPDFYASAYGEATLYLDAAYSSDVEPGSRLSVLVNGELSTAISFTSSRGEVFEDFPITLPMRNFRPGVNQVAIVADLETEADRACLPGGTVPSRDRFVLFSSTELVFPEFARIGQLPNLASFATNGSPYSLSPEPVRVYIGGTSFDTIGAAGTLMSNIAISRGMPISTNVIDSVSQYADAGAIIVAPLQDVSTAALEATGASRVIPATWLQPFPPDGSASEPEGLERYDAVLRRLRQQLRQEEVRLDRAANGNVDRGVRQDIAADPLSDGGVTRDRWFEDLQQERGIGTMLSGAVRSLRNALSLGFSGRSRGGFAGPGDLRPVGDDATLILAQAPAPANDRSAWTLVTAPTAGLLSASVAAISAPDDWNRIGGQITAFDVENSNIQTVAVGNVNYLATVPLTFANFRLIAANWFSINSSVYAVVLVVAAAALGFLTWLLVRPVGRKD
ncbi:MAG: cellulose biosynthesis cyclic di-GMP-binding regulatory protein BcsB [Pseudomonadota bacterium]